MVTEPLAFDDRKSSYLGAENRLYDLGPEAVPILEELLLPSKETSPIFETRLESFLGIHNAGALQAVSRVIERHTNRSK